MNENQPWEVRIGKKPISQSRIFSESNQNGVHFVNSGKSTP